MGWRALAAAVVGASDSSPLYQHMQAAGHTGLQHRHMALGIRTTNYLRPGFSNVTVRGHRQDLHVVGVSWCLCMGFEVRGE